MEPKNAGHLFAVKQAPGESLHNFFRKFVKVKCQVRGVNETTIINVATCRLQKGPLSERLARKLVRTVTELFDKMEEYAWAKEDSTRRAAAPAAQAPILYAPPTKGGPAATTAVAPAKPRANDYRQKGRNIYHVDGSLTPEGGRRGGCGRG